MDYLESNNYIIWPVRKILYHLENKIPLPDKCVGLTFDDNHISIYNQAYPILRSKKFPFTIFINTKTLGKGKSSLNWQQIIKMDKDIAEIANHSHTHPHLIRYKKNETHQQWENRIREEILIAEKLIEKHTGKSLKQFVYPYGEYTLELTELLSALGFYAFGQQSGPVGFFMPLTIIPRFPMGANFGKKDKFIQKLHTIPMPNISNKAIEPFISIKEAKPTLPLLFTETTKQQLINQGLQCYVSGQGKANKSWLKQAGKTVVLIQAKNNLNAGRSRYNCTMRLINKSKYQLTENYPYYHWYSQLWIVKNKDGSWYKE